MKQKLLISAFCVYLMTGCNQSSLDGLVNTTPSPSPTPAVVADDLDILNGTTLLATGINATATAGTPANCASQLAFLPKKLKGWVVAYGISSFPEYSYSYCSAKITCTAGDQYELLEDGGQGSIASFQSGGAVSNYATVPFTCPQSGNYEISFDSTYQNAPMLRLKLIKTPSQTAVDTEYVTGVSI